MEVEVSAHIRRYFSHCDQKCLKYVVSLLNDLCVPTLALETLSLSFVSRPHEPEAYSIQTMISTLRLLPHIEGGYFSETDMSPDVLASPFPIIESIASGIVPTRPGFDPFARSSSTSILYPQTPNGPQGGFHRNKARTVHTLHIGRGRYVVIHADELGEEKRIESFVVGHDIARGEKLQ